MDPSGSGGGGDENHLRIGDFVLLNINRLNGFLWGDGILRDDCKLQRKLKKKYGAKIEPVGCTLPAAIDAQKIHVTAV